MSENERKIVKRSDKKAFWGIGVEATSYSRMRGFTELSGSKNPIEYERQYVDEKSSTTDVVGYSPSWSFGFDDYSGDPVLADMVEILDNETLGADAQRDMILVDFSRPNEDGSYPAVKRRFAVIGDSEGDGAEAYTYSGNFKAAGEAIHGKATITSPENGTPDTVQEITFAKNTTAE